MLWFEDVYVNARSILNCSSLPLHFHFIFHLKIFESHSRPHSFPFKMKHHSHIEPCWHVQPLKKKVVGDWEPKKQQCTYSSEMIRGAEDFCSLLCSSSFLYRSTQFLLWEVFSTGTEFKATGCPGARLASTEKLNHFPYRACALSDVQDLIRITSSALSRSVCVCVFKRGLFTVCQVWEASSSGARGLHAYIIKDTLSTAAKEVYNTWRQLSVHLNSSCLAGARLQEVRDLKSAIFAACLFWANQLRRD